MQVSRDRNLRASKLLLRLKCGNLEKKTWNFDYPATENLFKTATDTLVLRFQTRHSGANIDRVHTGSWHSAKESRHDVGDTTLSFARAETNWKHSRYVPRCR